MCPLVPSCERGIAIHKAARTAAPALPSSRAVKRRPSSALVLAPLLVLGSLAAHAAAYVLAEPDGAERAALLARTGHGYLSWAPALVGAAVLALVAAFSLRVLGAARGVAARGAHPLLALVPVAGFVAQEAAERAVSGVAPAELLSERAFFVGLGVQAVCGVAALLLSRLLVDGAERLGRLVAGTTIVAARRPLAVVRPAAVDLLRSKALAFPAAGRAPPAPAS